MEEVRRCSCVSLEAKEQSNKSARCVGLFGPLSVSTVVERGEKVENVHVQLNRHTSSSFDLIHVGTALLNGVIRRQNKVTRTTRKSSSACWLRSWRDGPDSAVRWTRHLNQQLCRAHGRSRSVPPLACCAARI